MMTFEKLEKMDIAFDFSNPFVIAKVPEDYHTAEDFALRCVYTLGPLFAKKMNIDYSKVVLVAISKNNKVVVYSVSSQYRDWLYLFFKKPSMKYAQFYDDVEPEQIIEKMKELSK